MKFKKATENTPIKTQVSFAVSKDSDLHSGYFAGYDRTCPSQPFLVRRSIYSPIISASICIVKLPEENDVVWVWDNDPNKAVKRHLKRIDKKSGKSICFAHGKSRHTAKSYQYDVAMWKNWAVFEGGK